MAATVEQSEDHIRVVARFRPINGKEKHEEKMQNLSSEPISLYNNSSSVSVPRINKPVIEFTLDEIIWTDSTQQQAFETLSKPLIDQVMKGYNCSIFAFGQTGSGKTYTMFGPDNYSRVEQLGIIPRSVDYLFSSLSEGKDILNYQVTLSVIEIYKEQTCDLLNTSKKKKRLEIFVSGPDVIIKHLIERSCKDVDDVLSHIIKAQASRNTRTTDFIGHQSSRSHCVVMISVTQRLLDDTVKTSKMSFADLAGSELASRTGAKGDTLKEAGKIHQGLLALENVINALVDRKKHVPYKDSNLTRILIDSLGGNSKTTLLVACSPHIWNRSETVSTLRFAARAKKIKNKARINQRRTRDQLEQRIRALEDTNISLRKKLKTRKSGKVVVETDGFNDEKVKEAMNEIERLKELLRKKEDRIQQMEKDLKSKDDYIDEMNKEFTKKTKKSQLDITERDDNIEELQNKLKFNENEIQRISKQLEHDTKLQISFNDHKQQMSNMVNETMADQTTATVGALTELQKQQKEFYQFMRLMQSNIDKIHSKQMDHDKKLEEIQNKDFNIVHNYQHKSSANEFKLNDDIDDEEEDDDDIYLDADQIKAKRKKMRKRLSTASIILPPDMEETDSREKFERAESNEALDNVITSMTSYLERSRTGRFNMNDLKKGANEVIEQEEVKMSTPSTPLDVIESVTTNTQQTFANVKTETIQIKNKSRNKKDYYRIGTHIDAMDSSFHWYSAEIVDIDIVHKKALKVHYDGFHAKWDEWIPFNKAQFRIDLHTMKSQGNGRNEGGIHALVATKYGTSRLAVDLRLALDRESDKLLHEVNVLLEGYLFKRGNWNKDWKKRWFVLGNTLNIYYYESMHIAHTSDKHYRGVIALVNIRKIVAVTNGFTNYSFDIQTPSRVYHFSCLNESELKDWMSVLECLMNCSFDNIAPKNTKSKSKAIQMLGASPVSIDPNRFKNKAARSPSFYKLTTSGTGTAFEYKYVNGRHQRSVSMFDRMKMKLSKKSVTNTENNNV